MALNLQPLIAEVQRQKTIKDGLIVLLRTLRENQGDPAELQRIVTDMDANSDELAAALEEGTTPAEPA
jgi:hypothetical protein